MIWALALLLPALAAAAGLLEPDRTYFVLVTDPHGVYSGHPHQPQLSGDYPALSSMVDSLREQAKQLPNCHVYFFENGDLVDGGGLTSVDEGKKRMFPLLSQVGFDARTLGNHELYVKRTVELLQLPGDFVTSNIVWRNKLEKHLGHKFKIVGENVLTLGFLYDMTNYDPTLVMVKPVEQVMREEWFQQAVQRTDIRSIVVLAHMDYVHPLAKLIFNTIRTLRKDQIPIVIATGHTHQRRHKFFDSHAISLEAGKFMDTVGLVSFRTADGSDFKHLYLTPTHDKMLAWSNNAKEDSPKAVRLRTEIQKVRNSLQLDKVVGVLDKTYTLQANVGSENSLITFWTDRVIEHSLFAKGKEGNNRLFFVGGTGTLRYNLFAGKVTKDDLWIVSPFADPFHVMRNVPGWLVLMLVDPLLGLVQAKLHPLISQLPLYTHSSLKGFKILAKYDLVVGTFDLPYVLEFFKLHRYAPQHAVFRPKDGIDGHTVWVKYFELLKLGGGEEEAQVI